MKSFYSSREMLIGASFPESNIQGLYIYASFFFVFVFLINGGGGCFEHDAARVN